MKHSLCAAALFAAFAVTGCRQTSEPPEQPGPRVSGDTVTFPPASSQAAALTARTAEPAQPSHLHMTGRLVWNEEATVRIFTAFEGRITRILAPIGQRIEAGAALATIASPDFGQVQADAAKSALDLRQAEQNLTRLQELTTVGAVAQKELRAAEIDLARSRSEFQRTARRLELYESKSDRTDHDFMLKSPLPGVVVEKNINPGQIVRPDQITANAPPLFVVTDPERLWVLLDATEQVLPLLQTGTTVALNTPSYAGVSFTATIESISDAIDSASRTIKVRAAVANPERKLKAEMFVTADIIAPRIDGVDIASGAVFLKGNRHFVFVDQPRGTYHRREVTIVTEHDDRQIVTHGVASGESVVVEGGIILDQLMSEGSAEAGGP